MTRFFKLFFAFALFVSAAPQAAAQAKKESSAISKIEPAKRKEIERLIELTGMTKMVDQLMRQGIDSVKDQHPEISDEFWIRVQNEIKSEELIALFIPLYDKFYTVDDLKAVNAFYSTPAGKRMLSSMPELIGETTKVAEKWGTELGERVAKELEKEKADAADQN